MTETQKVFAAIEARQVVMYGKGRCVVMKWKNGKAKIRRVHNGVILEAWVPIETFTTIE